MVTTAADIIARFSDTATAEVAFNYADSGSNIRRVKILRAFMEANHPTVEVNLAVLVQAVKGINSYRRMTIDCMVFDFVACSS